MDAIDAIITRRSVRKYKDIEIDKNKITKLLEIGMCAPSAGNEQPWHFVVISKKETLQKIQDFHPHSQCLKFASYGILVCFDVNLEKHIGMAVQDCSAATQNILIAVNAMGLGAVWLGVYPRKERIDGLRDLLCIPENIVPFSLISIGYPFEEIQQKIDRFKKSRVHLERW